MSIYKSPKLIEEEKAKQASIPKLEYFTVEVEALVPTIIKYKVYATSPEEALKKINASPVLEQPKHKISKMIPTFVKVFKFGTHLLKYSRKL